MGTETLTEVAEGDQILLETGNATVRALRGEVVPRNQDGVATAGAGNLGTEQYSFRELHVRDLIINGTPAARPDNNPATTQLFANGVVRGMAPTGRPGMCGWMNEAQDDGIVLHATTEAPLVVRVGGQEYTLTADITGGGVPSEPRYPASAIDQWSSLNEDGPDTPPPDEIGNVFRGMATEYAGFSGREMRLRGQFLQAITLPAEFENNIIIRLVSGPFGSQQVEYSPFQLGGLIRNNPTVRRALRGGMNVAARTGYGIRNAGLIDRAAISLATLAYVFVDPTTDPWTIHHEKQVVGSVSESFPTGAANNIVYRESNNKWYRFEGGAWVEKEWVLLGISATTSRTTQAVLGARTEDSLRKLRSSARLLHSTGRWDRNRAAFYTPSRSGNIITWTPPGGSAGDSLLDARGPQNYISQQHRPIAARYRIDTGQRQDRDLANDSGGQGIYNVWVSAETGEAFSDKTVPNQMELAVGEVVLIHPHQNAVWIGSYSVDNNSLTTNRINLPNETISVGEESAVGPTHCPAIWYRAIIQVPPFGSDRSGIDTLQTGNDVFGVDTFSGVARRRWNDGYFLGPIEGFIGRIRTEDTVQTKQIRFELPTLGDIADGYYNVVD